MFGAPNCCPASTLLPRKHIAAPPVMEKEQAPPTTPSTPNEAKAEAKEDPNRLPSFIPRTGLVFSERTVVDRITELRTAMSRRWPKVRIAWSYKTNYLDGICKVFHSEGAWAEVVSGFEVEKALRREVQDQGERWNQRADALQEEQGKAEKRLKEQQHATWSSPSSRR